MEKIAAAVANWFKLNLELDEDKTEVVEYALITLGVMAATFILLLIFCGLLGVVAEGLVAIGGIGLLRMATGGAHLTSPWRCIFLSALVPAGFGLLAKHTAGLINSATAVGILAVAFGIGMALIFKYAPADVPEKPIKPERRGIYRKIGLGLAVLWALVTATLLYYGAKSLFFAAILGFLWQMFSLTPVGYRFYHYLSRFGKTE